MVMKLDHFCLAGKSFFMSSEGRYHLFQKIRFCFRVIIQKQYIRRACRMNSLIHSPAESIVFRKLDHVDPRIFRRNKSTAAVCGPIVHQYNLKLRMVCLSRLESTPSRYAIPLKFGMTTDTSCIGSSLLLSHSRKRLQGIIPF